MRTLEPAPLVNPLDVTIARTTFLFGAYDHSERHSRSTQLWSKCFFGLVKRREFCVSFLSSWTFGIVSNCCHLDSEMCRLNIFRCFVYFIEAKIWFFS